MDKNGRHLIIDGNVKNISVFTHESLTNMFLDLVKTLDMKILEGPRFTDVELDPSKLTGDVFQDEGGTTGFCLISTSHIAIHTWELRKFFSMDIFSCKDFSVDEAMMVINKHLELDQHATLDILRRGADKEAIVNKVTLSNS